MEACLGLRHDWLPPGVLQHIPGAAILLQVNTEDGETVDLDPAVLEDLPRILNEDLEQRRKYLLE
jgi:hypothetical protein